MQHETLSTFVNQIFNLTNLNVQNMHIFLAGLMMTARPGYDGLACFMVKNNNVSEHGGQPEEENEI